MSRRAMSFCVTVLLVGACAAAGAGPPEIAYVFPDYPTGGGGRAPHIITGENFDPAKTELWAWDPKADEKALLDAIPEPGAEEPSLPDAPPTGSRRIGAMDVEKQVIVADLSGSVLWAKTGEGLSRPYLLNVARPFWISDQIAEQGALLYLYGFGMRVGNRAPRIVLKGKSGAVPAGTTIESGFDILEPRSPRHADTRLVYFQVPADAPPGDYTVYVHNGIGGQFGWRAAGPLKVIPRNKAPEKTFDVRRFGAKGDGLANDKAAIDKALAAAAKAAPAAVVFPPGTYLTDETIRVPAGVTLRGAGRDNTVIRGFGFTPHSGRPKPWYAPSPVAAAMFSLSDRTGLESLGVEGAVSKGIGDGVLIQIDPAEKGQVVERVTVADCRLRALAEDILTRRHLYRAAIGFGSTRYLRLLNNDIYGSLNFGRAYRADIIRNKFRGGTGGDVCSIHGWAADSLLDSNLFVETPGRVCFYPLRHCYIRYNEVHQAFRGTWANAEEIFLVHGSWGRLQRTIGFASDADGTTLVDEKQKWKPDMYAGCTVLIISGRGFGQYRQVAGNTADTLTLACPWRVVPDKTSEYVVTHIYVENAFFANLNNTPCRLSLWLDCIGNVVEMHRDVFAKGIDLWGGDDSRKGSTDRWHGRERFYPAYYNRIVDGWMDGTFVSLVSMADPANVHFGVGMFGNVIAGNRIRSPHMARTGFPHHPRAAGGVVVGSRRGDDMTKPQDRRVGLSHTFVVGNSLAFTNVGIAVSDYARKTFILRNQFQNVDHPVLDWGARTVMSGNTIRSVDADGERSTKIPDSTNPREIRSRR